MIAGPPTVADDVYDWVAARLRSLLTPRLGSYTQTERIEPWFERKQTQVECKPPQQPSKKPAVPRRLGGFRRVNGLALSGLRA